MMIHRASLLLLALAAATACSSHANQPDEAKPEPSIEAAAAETDRDFYIRVTDRLARVDPYVSVERIRTSTLDGWQEVHLFSENAGDQLAYVSDDLKTMFLGDMIDLETGASITGISALSIRADLLEQARGSALSFDADDEQYQFFVFTQPDCAECIQLHEDLPRLNAAGISVQYLAFPEGGLETEAASQLSAAWCAEDGRAAISRALASDLQGSDACQETVADHFGLGLRFGVSHAPTLISPQGVQVEGFPGAESLIEALEASEG